ncbi:MAG TPA: phospholipase D-like domain-containing protein [Burkholderiales bacterium]|nr:phospholipase D-like domain-containing protein [Burkholderiales bacterium]
MRRAPYVVCLLFGLWITGCALPPLPPAAAAQSPSELVIRDGERRLSGEEARRVYAQLAKEGDTDLLSNHLRSALGTEGSPLVLGNSAKLLIDGPATHGAMFKAIEAARDHINLQSYILADDETGVRLRDILVRKRAQGVIVNVLYDSVGSMDTAKEYFQGLRDAGIATCEFNPVNPAKAKGDWRINSRNHRKILVVDGRVAFTGGINISGVYSAGSAGSRRKSAEEGWRDTHIQVAGPIVMDAQQLFLDDWARYCNPVAVGTYYPKPKRFGSQIIRLTAGVPGQGNEIYAALLSAIEHAERSVHLTYGYFVPDPRTVEALKNAAQRGVDVTLMLPGLSDFWAPLYAGRSYYDDLLEAGITIYERPDALLHAKTAVIDSAWSSVGSTNLDWRSLVHNYEADIVVYGDEFGARMEDLFASDVRVSQRITLEAWRDRGVGSRFKEWFARRWGYLL